MSPLIVSRSYLVSGFLRPRFRIIPELANPFSIAQQTKTRIETTAGSWDSQNARD